MAKLERKNIKIFASQPNDATQVTSFLTAKDETPNVSSDPNVIQNANYVKGWLAEGNDNLPQVEDMNGVMYSESYKNAYLYQMGIAEWSVIDEYNENSFCQVEGVLYKSLIDNNIGNNPITDDGTNWKEIPLEPYNGDNLGTAEGIFAGKTTNNVLQFKSLAVSGNGDISSSDDTITIEIGGGETGSVYWGAIDGTLSNQSDLQQALNLKQNLIGYTPENITNKITSIRSESVATDVAYPTELATRTAIDDAILEANNYTDNALTNLSTDAFVLYANSWTDVQTGSLITTAPTGNGTEYHFTDIWDDDVEEIANFSFITTSETRLNNTFTYDVLIPIRNANINNWYLVATLTISHPDVNSGNETTIFDYFDPNVITINGEANYQFKQDLINISNLVYPIGSTVNLKVMVGALPDSGDTAPYNLDLLLYDSTDPLVISRNRGINRFDVTVYKTLARGLYESQECFNYYINSTKQPLIESLDINETSTTVNITPKPTITTSNIGSSSKWFSNSYVENNRVKTIIGQNYVDGITYPSSNSEGHTVIYDAGTTSQTNGRHEFRSGGFTVLTISENGETVATGDIVPVSDNSVRIGYNGQSFEEGTINKIYTQSILPTTGNTSINIASITIGGDFVPVGSDRFKIGASNSNYFSESYIKKMYVGEIHMGTGNASNLWFYTASNVRFENESSSGTINVFSALSATRNLGTSSYKWSNVYANNLYGTVQGGCDKNKKENIVERGTKKGETESALEKLKSLKTYTYNFKNDKEKRTHIGVMAQDLREIEPLLVTNISEKKDEEDLYVDIMGYCALLTESIQKLNEKVEYLEMRIEELEGNKKELEK